MGFVALHFFFLDELFSLDDFESPDLALLDFASPVFASLDFESCDFASEDLESDDESSDFPAAPSPEPSTDVAPEFLPL